MLIYPCVEVGQSKGADRVSQVLAWCYGRYRHKLSRVACLERSFSAYIQSFRRACLGRSYYDVWLCRPSPRGAAY